MDRVRGWRAGRPDSRLSKEKQVRRIIIITAVDRVQGWRAGRAGRPEGRLPKEKKVPRIIVITAVDRVRGGELGDRTVGCPKRNKYFG